MMNFDNISGNQLWTSQATHGSDQQLQSYRNQIISKLKAQQEVGNTVSQGSHVTYVPGKGIKT